MMKKAFVTLAMLAALAGTANAEVSSMQIGYCDGNVKLSTTDGFTSTEKDTYISSAIFLPKKTLDMFSGCSINEVKAGMASSLNIDELKVWVRSSLDGENLAEGVVTKETTPPLSKGWNNVKLETPYDIASDTEGLYVGITFHQVSASAGLSVVTPETVAPVEGGLYVKMGTDAEWEDRSDVGVAVIEALVYGDNLPKYNLQLRAASCSSTFVVSRKTLDVTATVRNIATCTINGFDVVCSFDGTDETVTTHFDQTLPYNGEKKFEFTIEPPITTAEPLERVMTLTVSNLQEGDDQYPEDNVLTAGFDVVLRDVPRQVVVEEFTTEKCPNCPRVATQMHDMLARPGYDERVNVICHHSAYYTDWLTIPADNQYLWLFNMNGTTFAPALTIDRVTRPGISNRKDNSPIFSPTSADHICEQVSLRMDDVAFVSLDIAAELTDGNAYVTVTGERVKQEFTNNPARIVVGLIEDNIKAQSQSGGGSDFVHQHVNRAYNSVWGEEIAWDGNNYSYSCNLKLNSGYVKENLRVVAYIWDYDPNDVTKCEISNSNRLVYSGMVDNTSGVSDVTMEETEVEYYNIDGMRLDGLCKGINIVRHAGGRTEKVIVR